MVRLSVESIVVRVDKEAHMEGARLEVTVHPRAKRNDLSAAEDGKIRVYVTAAPERGKANESAISLLADRLGVAKGRILILHGQRARRKVFLIEEMSARDVGARLGSKDT